MASDGAGEGVLPALPDRISVVCSGLPEEAHEDRQITVATFVHMPGNGRPWQLDPIASRRPQREAVTILIGDEPLTEDVPLEDELNWLDEGRHRYDLRCAICRRTAPITDENLHRLLDGLRNAGRATVELPPLVATLTS